MGAPLGPEFAGEESERMSKQAKAFSLPDLLRVIRLFNDAAGEARVAWQPSLPLEMAFVEALHAPAALQNAAPVSGTAAKPSPTPSLKQQIASPPSSSTPAAVAPAAPSQAAPLDNQDWLKVKDALKTRNPNLHGLLNSVKARELRGNILFLGFASDLLKEKMEKTENIELLQTLLDEAMGSRLEVRCFLASGKSGELPPGLDSSGMVAAAVRLGGEIVDKNELGKSGE